MRKRNALTVYNLYQRRDYFPSGIISLIFLVIPAEEVIEIQNQLDE